MKSMLSKPLMNIIVSNCWAPPEIPEYEYALAARDEVNAHVSNEYFYIFQVEPYIDAIFIVYDDARVPKTIRRFTFHEGYRWNREDEIYFHDHCVKSACCGYDNGLLDSIYQTYLTKQPGWHLQRYYTRRLWMLDHIYHCMCQNTVKEMLYKAGLDYLAANIDELDEINLLSTKPPDIYDGIPMRVLRNVNCKGGAKLLANCDDRAFVRELNYRYPDTFSRKLNDAQCVYLLFLILGKLTVGEVRRVFNDRRYKLGEIWSESQLDIFLAKDVQVIRLEGLIRKIDPIYGQYIDDDKRRQDDYAFQWMEYYLIDHREEYNQAFRRSNRKRQYEWQERNDTYIVRYPQTINDFCREAIYMRNCMLAYVDEYLSNDTTILFMRRADDVNTPFITIEVYDGVLKQAYHRFNTDCTEEEADWIRGYCFRHGIDIGNYQFNADLDLLD